MLIVKFLIKNEKKKSLRNKKKTRNIFTLVVEVVMEMKNYMLVKL